MTYRWELLAAQIAVHSLVFGCKPARLLQPSRVSATRADVNTFPDRAAIRSYVIVTVIEVAWRHPARLYP